MDTPARAAPKYHLLFLLLLLLLVIVCSSGVFFSPAKDIEHQQQQQRRLQRVAPNPPLPTGQIWCVARSRLQPASLQGALDYACGNGADCGAIQQGGNCSSPNTLQNHASYAFNSYYHNHPGKPSCGFGGAAVLTYANPSNGTCIYPPTAPSSTTVPPTTPLPTTTPPPTTAPSSTTVPPTTPLPTTTPTPKTTPPSTTLPPTTTTTTIPTPTTATSSGSSATPPSISNGRNNSGLGGSTTGFGGIPPITSPSPISMSSNLHQSFIGCIVVVTSFITWVIVLDI